MLFNTTAKRMARFSIGAKKFSSSKKYLKEVNKSARNLYKDIRSEATNGQWDTAAAYAKSMRNEIKTQKRGFFRIAIRNSMKDSQTLNVITNYGKSVKKALRTGKLYRRETDMFDDLLNRSAFDTTQSYDTGTIRASNASVDATYDSARATISSINSGTSAQLEMQRVSLADGKASSQRLNSIITSSANMQAEKLQQIYDFQNDVLRNQIDESLKLGRERNAILTEIRDLNKKMIINNDNYQQAAIENNKSFLELAFEGKWKDAFGKATEEMMRQNQDLQNLNNVRRSGVSMLGLMASNPLMFMKSMITDSKQFKNLMGNTTGPKQMAGRMINRMGGSSNAMLRFLGNSMIGNENETLSTVSVKTHVNRGAMQWNGDAHQSLVEVIPTYLRKILSSLEGGQPELIYNYATNKFRTKADMEKQARELMNESVAGGRVGTSAAKMTEWFKQKTNSAKAPDFVVLFDAFINDIARGGIGAIMDIKSILEWSYETYIKRYPNSAFIKTTEDLKPGENLKDVNKALRENYDMMRVAARALIDSDKEFAQEIMSLESTISSWRKRQMSAMKEIVEDSTGSGFSVFANGADRFKIKGAGMYGKKKQNNNGNNGPSPHIERDVEAESRNLFKRYNSSMDIESARDIVAGLYSTDDETNKFFDRISSMSYEDFKYHGIALNVTQFKAWAGKKYNNLSQEDKDALGKLFKAGMWDDIRAKLGVGEFDAYLMKIRDENIFDLTKSTDGEKRKAKIYDDRKKGFKRFNNAYEGIHSSLGSIADDPAKRSAMSAIITKVAVAGGLTAFAGGHGMIPFLSVLGPHGVTIAALTATAMGIAKNKDTLKDLLTSGMTDEQKADTKFVSKNIFSKLATGFGVAGIAGLGGSLLGVPPFMVPLVMGAAGIAAGMNSEKSGFKKFFFGEGNEDKTFFDLFRNKMIGDPEDENDDGMFGRAINPLINGVKNMFTKMNEGFKKNILGPLFGGMKRLVQKFDDSATGQQFNDLLGFSLSEFGSVMKKNVWEPLTGKLFGGLKSLLGFGRKHRDKAQEEMLNPYEQSDELMNQARAENATAGAGVGRGKNIKRGDFSIGGKGTFGGAVFTDMADIRTSFSVNVHNLEKLIGKDKSNPSKHYYSQKDPDYSELKINVASKIDDEGCGVMAAAMVVSRMGRIKNDEEGKSKTEASPKWVESHLIPLAKKKTLPKIGTHYSFFMDVARRFALEAQVREGKIGFSMKELEKLINGGKGSVVCLLKQPGFDNHYIVITGVNGDRVFYDDPARRRNLNMTYDELIAGSQKFIGFSKNKGLFGILGKMFRGLIRVFDGSKLKEKRARQWGVSRDFIDKMTRKEWDTVKGKRSISDELFHEVSGRKNKFTDHEGKTHDTWGKLLSRAQEVVGNAGDNVDAKLDAKLDPTASMSKKEKKAFRKEQVKAEKARRAGTINDAGAGVRKVKKKIAENFQDTIPGKSKYPKGDRVPSIISKKLVFKDENEWRSAMFSATLNNTHVLGTMLAAIHTKLTELEVATYNGTNGVAYNVEHIKRSTAIKNFGSMGEADKAVGPIDQKKLANFKFARRGGVVARIKQGITDIKDLVRSKTIDPVMQQYYIMKMTLGEWKDGIVDALNPMKLIDGVKDFFRGAFDKAWGFVNTVADTIGKGFKAVGTVVGGALKGIGSTIKGVVVGLGEAIGGIGKGIGEAVSGVVGGIVDTISEIPRLLTDTLVGFSKAITTTMSGVVGVIGKVGGLGYRGVRRVVKDMWHGAGAVFRGIGTGAVAIRDYFSGKMNDTAKDGKRISYVRVLGGHIDTVGTVGAVDRDAYVKDWKSNYRQVSGRSVENGRISGRATVRNGKLYNDIDKEQDKVSEVQDKQTTLLERIAGNAGGGSTTVVNDNRGSMGWMDILKTLTPTIMGLGYLLTKFMNRDEKTTGGNPMGPEEYTGARDAMTSEDNPFDISHAISTGKWVGRKALNGINKITQPFKTAGQGIAKGWRTVKGGIAKGGKHFKGAADYISHTKLGGKLGLSTAEASAVRSGQLVKSGDDFFKLGAGGVIEKTTMVMDDVTGKMVPEVTTFVDDVAKKSAEKAAKAAATGASSSGKGIMGKVMNSMKTKADDVVKSWGAKAASYMKNMIIKTLENNTVKKMFGEEICDTLAKNADGFVMKLVSNPSVKAGLLKNAGKVLSGLSKWVPVLNVAMFLYDLYAGWRDADKYFSVPEFKLTTKMRVAGSLTRAIQGLVAMIPWLLPIAFVPTEWFVSAVWAMIGKDAEKKELEATKLEYGKRYDEYKRSMESSGKKPETYDDWIREVGDTSKSQNKMAKYGGIGFIDNTNKQLQKLMVRIRTS